jgi:YbbR domain-containing protein
MMRFLRRLFLNHLGLKISALVIATGLWIAFNSEPVVETGFSAPLLLVNVPAGMQVTSDVPAAVLLRVRGRLARLRRFEPGELSVSADCSQAHAGSQVVKLAPYMVRVPYGAEIVGIAPPQIDISLVSGSAPATGRK